ncbi:hypothetical protein [Azospirillum picis]|uniref:Uncharacterized protein n=1 Tax=Azospirillum picis TaxID=488438 RepID=A0ABU0MUV1_9PROT|nr:hypothetical protein [Azospirillum picis]MBP2301890.1 hypothetical protein [Azospirillum picis]MDQ0537242.1 hypothetical protein [Azospirillum picis]
MRSLFAAPGHEIVVRRLTWPGGAFDQAELYWRPREKLWAYFSEEPEGGQPRWLCWFGREIGESGQTIGPSIEINLPLDPGNRQIAGRSLVDASGKLYLGHKGGLGGGRGGQMRMEEFAARIKGFVREPILLPGDREDRVFVVGALEDPDFLIRLRAYVQECARLRAFAKARAAAAGESAAGNSAGTGTDENDEDDGEGGFTPENALDGTGSGHPGDIHSIRRVHGRVVNALRKKLGKKAVNGTHSEMRPDLYVLGPGKSMTLLFEVKASSDTQSWFTAIGQLLVYGAGSTPAPRRVLVCPALRSDPNFQKVLADLAITVVTFKEEAGGRITFDGLDALQDAAG